MRSRRIVLRSAATTIAIALSVCASAQRAGLCTEKEDFLFTCTLENKKVVSACGEPGSNDDKYKSISYRYGVTGGIELSIPVGVEHFESLIDASELTSSKPIEDDTFLRFAHGPYKYVLYTATGDTFDFKGLAVFKGDSLLKNQKCQADTFDIDWVYNTLIGMGVHGDDGDGKDLLLWKAILPAKSAALKSLYRTR